MSSPRNAVADVSERWTAAVWLALGSESRTRLGPRWKGNIMLVHAGDFLRAMRETTRDGGGDWAEVTAERNGASS